MYLDLPGGHTPSETSGWIVGCVLLCSVGSPLSAVGTAEARPWRAPVKGAELPAEGEILQGELGTGSESRAKGGEQVQEEGNHDWVAHDVTGRHLPYGFPRSQTRTRPSG